MYDLTIPIKPCEDCHAAHADIWRFLLKRVGFLRVAFPAFARLRGGWKAHCCPGCGNLLLLHPNPTPLTFNTRYEERYKFVAGEDLDFLRRWSGPLPVERQPAEFIRSQTRSLKAWSEESETLPCAATLKSGETFEQAVLFAAKTPPVPNKIRSAKPGRHPLEGFRRAALISEVAELWPSRFALPKEARAEFPDYWRPMEERVAPAELLLMKKDGSIVYSTGRPPDFVDLPDVSGSDLMPIRHDDPRVQGAFKAELLDCSKGSLVIIVDGWPD